MAGPSGRSRRPWSLLGAGAAAGVVAGAGLALVLSSAREPGPPRPVPLELVRLTSDAGLEHQPSWSPDGRSLAYATDVGGHLGIAIRQVPGERAIRVGQPGVDEAQPAWSPDGNWIAFVSSRNRGGRFGIFLGARAIEFYVLGHGGDLFLMPALGGTARKLADDAYDPSWSPDGRRLGSIDRRRELAPLHRVDRRWAHRARRGRRAAGARAGLPAWGPGDRTIVFSVAEMTGDLFLRQPAGVGPRRH